MQWHFSLFILIFTKAVSHYFYILKLLLTINNIVELLCLFFEMINSSIQIFIFFIHFFLLDMLSLYIKMVISCIFMYELDIQCNRCFDSFIFLFFLNCFITRHRNVENISIKYSLFLFSLINIFLLIYILYFDQIISQSNIPW